MTLWYLRRQAGVGLGIIPGTLYDLRGPVGACLYGCLAASHLWHFFNSIFFQWCSTSWDINLKSKDFAILASSKVPFSLLLETSAWLSCFKKRDVVASPHWHFGTFWCSRCPEMKCALAWADVKNSRALFSSSLPETFAMILQCFALLSMIMFLLSITVSCWKWMQICIPSFPSCNREIATQAECFDPLLLSSRLSLPFCSLNPCLPLCLEGSVAIFQAGLFSNIAHAPPKLQDRTWALCSQKKQAFWFIWWQVGKKLNGKSQSDNVCQDSKALCFAGRNHRHRVLGVWSVCGFCDGSVLLLWRWSMVEKAHVQCTEDELLEV